MLRAFSCSPPVTAADPQSHPLGNRGIERGIPGDPDVLVAHVREVKHRRIRLAAILQPVTLACDLVPEELSLTLIRHRHAGIAITTLVVHVLNDKAGNTLNRSIGVVSGCDHALNISQCHSVYTERDYLRQYRSLSVSLSGSVSRINCKPLVSVCVGYIIEPVNES
jgi:hypothetical protein